MDRFDTIEMLAFKLKMLGSKSRKRILISAGKIDDKRRMLPAIERLSRLQVELFATQRHQRLPRGRTTSRTSSLQDQRAGRAEHQSALNEDRLDLIINVLTGNNDYDESSDSNLIRTLAIEHGIPLMTDLDIAILTIDQIVPGQASEPDKIVAAKPEPWNLKAEFFQLVETLGGFASYHAHFDKAYLISMENLRLGQVDMQKKWELYKYLKENYTHDDLVERISRGVEAMIAQGVTHCRTMVDADSTVELLPGRRPRSR